ncbi:4Fe-4S binding protein [Clostridia bacterium]|nr:4Fe-4S binding protein [Clostridia bacterium]
MKKSKENNKKAQGIQVAIVYFSPSGSAKKVAEAYQKEFHTLGSKCQMLPLARSKEVFDKNDASAFWKQLEPCDLLLVGGPIYIKHMQYHLLDLIYEAPFANTNGIKNYAAVFSTFGKVSSGVGLAETARILSRKGYSVISGLDVDSLHSATRLLAEPVSQGLPGAELDAWIKTSVKSMLDTVQKRKKGSLDLILSQSYDDFPELKDEKSVLASYPTVTFDETKCIACGRCVKSCPTLDLTLDASIPTHREESHCIHCTNCLVVCPEDAVILPLENRSKLVLGLLKKQRLEPSSPSRTKLYLLG